MFPQHRDTETGRRLRENVATRDALYLAAAMALDARLVTTDERSARAAPELAVAL